MYKRVFCQNLLNVNLMLATIFQTSWVKASGTTICCVHAGKVYVQSKKVLLVRPTQLKTSSVIWRLWLMGHYRSSPGRQRLNYRCCWKHYLTMKICISPIGLCDKLSRAFCFFPTLTSMWFRIFDWYSKAYELPLQTEAWLAIFQRRIAAIMSVIQMEKLRSIRTCSLRAFSAICHHPFLAYLQGANLEWDKVWSLLCSLSERSILSCLLCVIIDTMACILFKSQPLFVHLFVYLFLHCENMNKIH